MTDTFGPRKASPWALDQLGVKDKPDLVVQDGFRQAQPWATQQAASGRMQVGGPEARMAMFPDEFTDKADDKPNIIERGARGIAMGIASMIPASMTVAGGVIEFLGADELGAGVAEAGLGVDEWLQDHVAVENPQFADHLFMGIGSMASFLLPGLGAAGLAGKGAQAIGLAGKAATAFKAVTGAGAMSFLESSVEQAQRQQELMAQGQTPAEALGNSEAVFWQNMGVLTATNAASFFLPVPLPAKIKGKFLGRVANAVEAAFSEGGQERAQAVIQDVAAGRGEWADFLDPSKHQTETAIGAIVGGGAGLVLPGESGQEPTTPAENQPTDAGESTPRPIGGEPAPEDGAPEVLSTDKADVEERTQEEVLADVEQALEETLGEDVDLSEELTPPQLGELEEKTREAHETGDPAVADEVMEMAEGFLSENESQEDEADEGDSFDTKGNVIKGTKKAKIKAPSPVTTGESTEQVKPVEDTGPVTEDVPAPVSEESTITEDPIGTIKREAEKKSATKPQKSPEGFDVLPLAAIETEPEAFQVREDGGEFDEGFVQNAVDNFDEQAVNPIEVWLDPADGKFKVIDGHHTREILRRVGKTEAAVKIFKGTREEAIAASQKRNDERRGNDVLAQAGVVRGQREAGQSKSEVNKEAKRLYGRNWTTVVALSHLDPKGKLMESIRSMSGSSDVGLNDLIQMAKWIGKARSANSNLTNAHEREMFDDLLANKGKVGRQTEAKYMSFMDKMVDAFTDYSQPLNMKKLEQQNNVQRTFSQEIKDAKAALKEAEAARSAAEDKMTKRETPAALQEIALRKHNEAVAIARKELSELEQQESDVAASGGGEQSLFSKTETTENAQSRVFESNISGALKAGETGEYSLLGPTLNTPQGRMVRSIADRIGVNVMFFKSDVGRNGNVLGGFYNIETNTIFVNTSEDAHPVLQTAMHEIGHHIQRNYEEVFEDLSDLVFDNMGEQARLVFFAKRKSLGYSSESLDGELVAEMLRELSTNKSFWRALRNENPTMFTEIHDKISEIVEMIRDFVLKNNTLDLLPSLKNLEDVERAMASALSKAATERRASPGGSGSLLSIQTPRTARARAAVSRTNEGERAVRAAKSTINSWRDWPRHFYQKMVDKNTWVYAAVRKQLQAVGTDPDGYDASRRPDLLLQTMGAWSEQAEMALKSVVMPWDTSDTTPLSDGLQVIIKKFGLANSIDNGEFGQYVIARGMRARKHALAKEEKDYFGDDPSSEDYQQNEAEYNEMQELAKEYDALEPEWGKAVKAVSKWSNAMMTRLLQSGAISQAQHDGLVGKYDIYAPLFILDEQQAALPKGLQKADATHAGRVTWESEVMTPGAVRMDPMQGYIKNAYRLEFLAASNHAKMGAAEFIREQSNGTDDLPGFGKKVGPPPSRPVEKKIDELLDAMGLKFADKQAAERELGIDLDAMAKIWVAGNFLEDGTLAIMRDGEIEYWQLEKNLYNAYANIGNVSTHSLMKFFTSQTRLLRAGAVLTPEFMARNQMRDFLAAGVLSRHLVKNPVDAILLPLRILRGLSHAIKKDQVFQDFIMDKAGHSSLVALDQEQLRVHLDELNRSAGGVSFRWDKFVKNPAKFIIHSHPLTLLQAFSKLTENSTRLAVYEKSRADLMSQGMSETEARARAAIDSREASTDFGRSGEYGRIINMMIPFFNATVQGNDKMMRALFRDKGNRGATWSRGALMITMPSVLLWALNHDKDWYKDQPLWLKNHFWLFSLDDGKTIHKIPKPFEVGLLFGSLPERFLDWAADDDPEAMKAWVESLKKSFIVDPTDVMGPTVSALNDTRSNHDSFRDTPIVKGWLQRLEPRAQYTANTSEFAKWVGDTYPGRGLSPLMVDHFVKSAFGGIGQWSMELASNVVMMSDPKRKDMKPSSRLFYDTIPDWMPVIKAITISTPAKYTRQMDEFYKQYDRSQEAIDTFRSYKSGGATTEQIADLYERTGVDIGLHESLVRAADAIGRVSKQIRNVQMAPADMFDRGEKRKLMDELMDQRNKMIDEYMKRFNEVDRNKMQENVDRTVEKLKREIEQSNRR